MMRRLRFEEGALSPGFMLFVVVAAVASLFLVQFAHAHVLRTEAHTAADAAALAGAREIQRQMLATPPGLNVTPSISHITAVNAAHSYAGRNNAALTGHSISADQCEFQAGVRGHDNVTAGPSSELQQGRPEARARAQIQMPPLGAYGLQFNCTDGLSMINAALAGAGAGLPIPDIGNYPVDEPDPADYADPDDFDIAYEQWVDDRDEWMANQLGAFEQQIVGWAFGLLRSGSEIRLISSD